MKSPSLYLLCLPAMICLFGTPTSRAETGPAARPAWESASFKPWPSPVNPDALVVDGTTEIRWMPLPFEFKAGSNVRYIDYAEGDDSNDGLTKQTPWKHHPWDANAQGTPAGAKGVMTYVFKGGVIYRGALVAKESGTAEEPIRLTRDPSWGERPATIAGSYGIQGGWKQTTDPAALGFPEASQGKLWETTLPGDFQPYALWVMDDEGSRQRLTLARWPNWQIEHKYNHFTQWLRVEEISDGPSGVTKKIHAPAVLKETDPKAFDGAIVWTEHALSGNNFSLIGPFPSPVLAYDPQAGALTVQLTHGNRHPNKNSPFFIENLPRFLDEAGEWYFDAKSRRLFLRLPDDADPNPLLVEAAKHPVIIDIVGQTDIEIAGLDLTGGNSIDLTKGGANDNYRAPENTAQMPAIRLLGNCQRISLRHLNVFQTAGSGVSNIVKETSDVVQDIEISDSQFSDIDSDGIKLFRGFTYRHSSHQPMARLSGINIWRNNISRIGLRCISPQGGQGIELNGPEVADIAGNVIHWTSGHGINIYGGRVASHISFDAPEAPLIRILVRNNQVTDTILHKSDFGAIEFWWMGPVYVFNNVVANPVGLFAGRNDYTKNEAIYFDHGMKGFIFNNIGWSDSLEDAYQGILGETFLKEVRTSFNHAFHNTSYNFRQAYAREGINGKLSAVLANLMITVSHDHQWAKGFHNFWRFNEAEAIAFSRNLYAGKYNNIVDRWKGEKYPSLEEFYEAVEPLQNLVAKDLGWASDEMPVINPEARDFRLTDNSPAIDRGVRVFVPWSLYGNVGEWFFRAEPGAPNRVLSHDLYPQPFHNNIREVGAFEGRYPENTLVGEGFTLEDYKPGVLEDWNLGALSFDGTQSLRLKNEVLVADFKVENPQQGKEEITVTGRDRKTVRMDTNNFLIEVVFRAEPGEGKSSLVAKSAPDAGYNLGINEDGKLILELHADGQKLASSSSLPVNDGRWHHAIAEVDRAAAKITFYLNGKDASGNGIGQLPATASLDNNADFIVGQGFAGALDYLRVCRGTLADAKTTIEELMSWQFNGPHLHDMTGRPPTGGIRDIGALEHPTVSGLQPVVYTPRKGSAGPTEEDAFSGSDRVVHTTDWGSVSVPREAQAGTYVDVLVAFGTESLDREQILRIDAHGFQKANRITGLGHSQPVTVRPTETTPYTASVRVPDRDDLDRVSLIIYAAPEGDWTRRSVSTEVPLEVDK
jgi:hypothetical protein